MKMQTYRKRNKLTLEAAGEMFGVAASTVHRWEHGARPRARTIIYIRAKTGGAVCGRDWR